MATGFPAMTTEIRAGTTGFHAECTGFRAETTGFHAEAMGFPNGDTYVIENKWVRKCYPARIGVLGIAL